MNQDDKTYFADLLLQSHQSKDKEVSNLFGDIKQDIRELKSNYSKRELDHFMTEMHGDIKKILDQTTKTNGRVNSLESHRSYLWGAFSVATILMGTILFLAVMAIDNKIDKGIQNALSRYEVKITNDEQ